MSVSLSRCFQECLRVYLVLCVSGQTEYPAVPECVLCLGVSGCLAVSSSECPDALECLGESLPLVAGVLGEFLPMRAGAARAWGFLTSWM